MRDGWRIHLHVDKQDGFDGGYESCSCAKSMFVFAQEDLVYARDLFDHLVEEGAVRLDGEAEDTNGSDHRIDPFEHIEQYIASKGDGLRRRSRTKKA